MAAAAVQWSIDQLWTQLQKLQSLATRLKADLQANKAELTALWTQTTKDPDAKRRAANQALLRPLIHRNSELRLSYLAPIVARFNTAVGLARDALVRAGYKVPTLGGLGAVFVIAPLAAVTIIVATLSLAAIAVVLTEAQRNRTATVRAIMQDRSTTPEQKLALLQAQTAEVKAEEKAAAKEKPAGFDFGALVPLAAIVAVIVLGRPLLEMFGRRRSAT